MPKKSKPTALPAASDPASSAAEHTLPQAERIVFEQAMHSVTPLKPQNRITFSSSALSTSSASAVSRDQSYRRANAESLENHAEGHHRPFSLPRLSASRLEQLTPIARETALKFKRPGVGDRQFQRLKRGGLRRQSSLDLHGQTISQGMLSCENFINACQAARFNCIEVISGKGNPDSGQLTLKTVLNAWLPENPWVLAFCSAKRTLGGTGSFWILLKSFTPSI